MERLGRVMRSGDKLCRAKDKDSSDWGGRAKTPAYLSPLFTLPNSTQEGMICAEKVRDRLRWLYPTYKQPSELRHASHFRCRVFVRGTWFGLGSGVCGVGSQTPLRWKAPALSAFMLVLWIGALGGGFGGVTYLALKAISLTEKLADLGQLVQWGYCSNYESAFLGFNPFLKPVKRDKGDRAENDWPAQENRDGSFVCKVSAKHLQKCRLTRQGKPHDHYLCAPQPLASWIARHGSSRKQPRRHGDLQSALNGKE